MGKYAGTDASDGPPSAATINPTTSRNLMVPATVAGHQAMAEPFALPASVCPPRT